MPPGLACLIRLQEEGFLAALWTTPYGWAFDVKLCLVLIVTAVLVSLPAPKLPTP